MSGLGHEPTEGSATGRRLVAVIAMTGTVLFAWMLLIPPGGQPDEASHLVRSGALVRNGAKSYVLPDDYVVADPGCYAFQPQQPASCTEPAEPSGTAVDLVTAATDYPPAGHVVFGLATLLPGLSPLWWARLTATLISTLLIGFAIAMARNPVIFVSSLLVALTPMAWSIMTAVNPSAFLTAGALALWVGLLARSTDSQRARWLIAAGWVATVLPRRDGPIWACIILAVVLVRSDTTIVTFARSIGRGPMALMAASLIGALAWAPTASTRESVAMLAAPLVMLAAEGAIRLRRWGTSLATTRGNNATVATAIVLATLGFVLAWQDAGTRLALIVVNQTDDNLVEAIGVLGWLDAPPPAGEVLLWVMLVGMLAAVGLQVGFASLGWASTVLIITMLSAWTMELVAGGETGTYWQGRYSLPLLFGVPLLLARTTESGQPDRRDGTSARIARVVLVGSWLVLNVAAWAAARRFGVGIDGSYLPWRWDTSLHPVPPVIVLLLLGTASLLLILMVGPWGFTGRASLAASKQPDRSLGCE